MKVHCKFVVYLMLAVVPVCRLAIAQIAIAATSPVIEPALLEMLPNAPNMALLNNSPAPVKHSTSAAVPIASKFAHTIRPGQEAQPLSAADKMEYAIRDRLAFGALADSLWRSGIQHLRNSAPHYGTDSGAFGERLGAAALRQTTNHILTNGVFSAMLHDDPRYYQMGREHSFGRRALYAGTRPFITRRDDGRATMNIPRIAATVVVSAMQNLYYPKEDRGFNKSFKTGATSLAMKSVGYEFSEFMGDILRLVMHKKE